MTVALLVAADPARAVLRDVLSDGGLSVAEAVDATSAFERLLRAPRCGCIVLDDALPSHGARALLEWLVRSPLLSTIPVVLLLDRALPYRGPRPTHVVHKPFDPDVLVDAVRAAVAAAALQHGDRSRSP